MGEEQGTPEPYLDPPEKERKIEWRNDPFERFLPRKRGFITDLIGNMRGTEVPVIYLAWIAILAISSALKREVWIDWYPSRLFINFYLILLSPPGIGRKTTAITVLDKLLSELDQYVQDPQKKKLKKMELFRDKLSAEGLMARMHNLSTRAVSLQMKSGAMETRKLGCPITILVKEAPNMFGKAEWQSGILAFLLDIYDTKDRQELNLKKGREIALDLFTNLVIGCTTESFAKDLPATARSDGFLSRNIIAYVDDRYQEKPWAEENPHAPSLMRLTQRLAWIAENCIGKYVLSEEAKTYYKSWYSRYCASQRAAIQEESDVVSRKDVIVLKVAVCLRAQEYSSERIIEQYHIRDAIKLVEATYLQLPPFLTGKYGGTLPEETIRLYNFIKKRGKVTRARLMQAAHVSAYDCSRRIRTLVDMTMVEVWHAGKKVNRVQGKTDEEYVKVENGSNGEEEIEDGE